MNGRFQGGVKALGMTGLLASWSLHHMLRHHGS